MRENLVIRGGRVVDVARRSADARDIIVTADTITEVGPPGLAAPADARVVDASGKLLIPGLVNAHTHGHGTLARGAGDRWTLELLLNAAPWLGGNRTAEDRYLSTLIGAAEMVSKGCTAAYDLFYEFPAPTLEGLEAAARAYADVGMRAVIAPMMADRTFWEAIPGLLDALPADARVEVERIRLAPWETSLATSRRALETWKPDRDTIRLALAPTIPLHCSDEFMTGCRDLAREFGVGIHMHVAESKVQAVSGLTRYGRTLVGHIDTLGLLGPGFTAAHAIWLDDDDIARLADRGASVAHNPGSNMRLGAGVARVRRMLEHNLTVGVGTDGANCSDNLNVFEAMRLASLVSRIQGSDPSRWLATDEALRLATAGGARVLGFGDTIGRIAPGAKADIVFLDLASFNYVPLHDPVNQVVHAEDGTGVDSVMVGGRLVVDRRRLTTVDPSRLAAQAANAVERLRTANAPLRHLADRLATAVGTFCGSLAAAPYRVERHIASDRRP
ncbi:MAG: amidohydrolase [Candidatus Rokubacteria bacterium]|nr:amidohydrolase [Candidatus Rokubacteria bacterium]